MAEAGWAAGHQARWGPGRQLGPPRPPFCSLHPRGPLSTLSWVWVSTECPRRARVRTGSGSWCRRPATLVHISPAPPPCSREGGWGYHCSSLLDTEGSGTLGVVTPCRSVWSLSCGPTALSPPPVRKGCRPLLTAPPPFPPSRGPPRGGAGTHNKCDPENCSYILVTDLGDPKAHPPYIPARMEVGAASISTGTGVMGTGWS